MSLDPEDALKYRYIIVALSHLFPNFIKMRCFCCCFFFFLLVERQLSLRLCCFCQNERISRAICPGCSISTPESLPAPTKLLLRSTQVEPIRIKIWCCRFAGLSIAIEGRLSVSWTDCGVHVLLLVSRRWLSSPAPSNTAGSKWLLELSCWVFFSSFFFRLVPKQSKVLRQYVFPSSLASLKDNRTQTLSASVGTGVLKRLLKRCKWHWVLFLSAAHN